MKGALALEQKEINLAPIDNPFEGYQRGNDKNQNLVLRTKKGDRAVEVELPNNPGEISDFVIPVSPAFSDQRAPASAGLDDSYLERKSTLVDREITSQFPKGPAEYQTERSQIEQGLGLRPSDEVTPRRDTSYLAGVDHVKQLFKGGRFEAALIEVEQLLRQYQTDPKLYEMKGTLLDRLGHSNLAIRSWEQSIRLNPKNRSLKKFIDKRRKIASMEASK